VEDPEDAALLKSLIARHEELTGSRRAGEILSNWDALLAHFWKVQPKRDVVQLEAAYGAPKAKPSVPA